MVLYNDLKGGEGNNGVSGREEVVGPGVLGSGGYQIILMAGKFRGRKIMLLISVQNGSSGRSRSTSTWRGSNDGVSLEK